MCQWLIKKDDDKEELSFDETEFALSEISDSKQKISDSEPTFSDSKAIFSDLIGDSIGDFIEDSIEKKNLAFFSDSDNSDDSPPTGVSNETQDADDISSSLEQVVDSTEDVVPDTPSDWGQTEQVENVKRLTAQERRLRELRK